MDAVFYPRVLPTEGQLFSGHTAHIKIRVSTREMEEIRSRYHLLAAESTMKWICATYAIDYFHLDTIEVKPDPSKMEADIYMNIRPEHADKYYHLNGLGGGPEPLRAVVGHKLPDCQDELPKKDILMVRKKRSITLV